MCCLACLPGADGSLLLQPVNTTSAQIAVHVGSWCILLVLRLMWPAQPVSSRLSWLTLEHAVTCRLWKLAVGAMANTCLQ